MKRFQLHILSFVLTFAASTSHATSPRLRCSLKPLTNKEEEYLKELIKDSPEYKQIVSNKPSKVTINVSRCEKTTANIHASYFLFENILKKKCSVNSITFPLTINDKKLSYRKLKIQEGFISPISLTRSFLRDSIKKIANSSKAAPFFKKNIFCQIQYQRNGQEDNWVIQLRDNERNYCFLRSTIDGSDISVIRKLYAKSSKCS